MQNFPPLLSALIASTLFGTVPYFSIILYKSGFDAQSLLFWRYWLAIILLGSATFFNRHSFGKVPRDGIVILFLNAAILGTAQTYLYFDAIRLIPSSIVIVVFLTYPTMTLLIERFVFKVRLRPINVVATLLVLLGSALTAGRLESLTQFSPIGLVFAIGSAICYCVYLQVIASQMRRLPTLLGASLVYLGLGTGYLVIVLVTGLKIPGGISGWSQLAAIAVIGSAIPIACFSFAVPRLGPSAYGVVASSELLTVVTIGVLAIGEPFDILQLSGAALVVSGILLFRRA